MLLPDFYGAQRRPRTIRKATNAEPLREVTAPYVANFHLTRCRYPRVVRLMNGKLSRRTILKTAGAAALAMPAAYGASPLSLPATPAATAPGRPQVEGKDTPKICLDAALNGSPGNAAGSNDEAAAPAQRIRQPGVDHV